MLNREGRLGKSIKIAQEGTPRWSLELRVCSCQVTQDNPDRGKGEAMARSWHASMISHGAQHSPSKEIGERQDEDSFAGHTRIL